MDAYDKLKKIGAGVIIVLLALMMGIMFLPGSIEDFTGSLRSGGSVGQYDGRKISVRDYQYIAGLCAQRVPQGGQFGRFRDMMIKSCARRSTRDMYVLPDIGDVMGHIVSPASVREQLYQAAKQEYLLQGRQTDPDDKLSVDEIYDRLVRGMPMEFRMRQARAISARQALAAEYPFSKAQAAAAGQAANLTVDVDFVRYSDGMVLARLEKEVQVTEEQLKKAHAEEQSKIAPKNRKPFQTERVGVRNRLRSRLKTERLKQLKAALAKGPFSLTRVRTMTGAPLKSARGVTLSDLGKAKLVGGGQTDLNIPEFLAAFGAASGKIEVGPVVKDRQTYYLTATVRRRAGTTPDEKALKKQLTTRGSELAQMMLREMIGRQAERGSFKMRPVKLR